MVKSTTSFGNRAVLSTGLIVVSIMYALWQQSNSTRLATSDSATSSIAASYKAASDALLLTINQITDENDITPPKPTLISSNTSASSPTQTNTPATTPAPTQAIPTPVSAPTPAPRPTGQYVDGSYTGSAANAYYGTVQVKAIVSGGRIADVQFLQYPNDRSNSRYINSQAMPLLTKEAIQTQSAQVNGVSGATFTSQAFIQSLASALTQAKV